MQLRLLFFCLLLTARAAAQWDSGLRGRALFLELEGIRRLPEGERAPALVRVATDAAEPARELLRLLATARRSETAPGRLALLEAAAARVGALGANRSSTEADHVAADRALARLTPDTATQVRLLLADAAAFAGNSTRSAAYRLQAEAAFAGARSQQRLANLDALGRIASGPAVSHGYNELLRTASLSEGDRVHILSRLLINLCRLGAGLSAQEPARQLQAALRRPPAGYDAAEADLAGALYAEGRGRLLEASALYSRIAAAAPSPSATEGLIAAGDFHSRHLRADSARWYFARARSGAGFTDTPGLQFLWQQARAADAARFRQAVPAAFRAALQRQDSLYRAELQTGTRELALQYELLESDAKARALRDRQQLEALRYQQQRQRTWIALLALGCLSLLGLGAALLLNQRRRHAARLHAAELERREIEHRTQLMTELAQAQEAERGAIAGQLHDEIGTMLSVARMNLSAGSDPEHLQTAGKLLGDVAQTVRVMSHQLMPVALQQYGFRQAVEQLVADINAAGKLPVELALVGFGGQRFTDLFYSSCYRMLQELLQNVLKHADARHALVQLVEHPDLVSLMVEDDGRGIRQGSTGGAGLKLLASRVAFLQGSLHIESDGSAGTTVIIELPVLPAFLIQNEHAATRTDLHRG
ncbi:sensor histidine kinase [Flaviaesturariibacter terrae]